MPWQWKLYSKLHLGQLKNALSKTDEGKLIYLKVCWFLKKPVLIKTQYSFNPYILIKRPYLRKQIVFPYPTFQTAFRRNREIEATK